MAAFIREDQYKWMVGYKGGVIRGLLSQLEVKFKFDYKRIILTGRRESCKKALAAINAISDWPCN